MGQPDGTLPWCARFVPEVGYSLVGEDERVKRLTAAQRLYLTPEGQPSRAATLTSDCEDFFEAFAPECILPNPGFDLVSRLKHEELVKAVTGGNSGEVDNFHCTLKGDVELPNPLQGRPAGCPECVHVHWRWGTLTNRAGEGFTDGRPIVPTGSDQDVKVAVVARQAGEDDPRTFASLVDPRPVLGGRNVVLWYAGTGYQDSDRFFTHGGFFSAAPALRAKR